MKWDHGSRWESRQAARSDGRGALGIAGWCRLLGAVLLVGALVVTPCVAPRVCADDPLQTLDRDLLEALEGKPAKDSPLQIIPRLLEGTRTAASRLQEG